MGAPVLFWTCCNLLYTDRSSALQNQFCLRPRTMLQFCLQKTRSLSSRSTRKRGTCVCDPSSNFTFSFVATQIIVPFIFQLQSNEEVTTRCLRRCSFKELQLLRSSAFFQLCAVSIVPDRVLSFASFLNHVCGNPNLQMFFFSETPLVERANEQMLRTKLRNFERKTIQLLLHCLSLDNVEMAFRLLDFGT